MTLSTPVIVIAILRFAVWQAALFSAAIPLARVLGFGRFRRVEEQLLAVLAVELTLESSFAGLFSFLGVNSTAIYWVAGGVCLSGAVAARNTLLEFVRALPRLEIFRYPRTAGVAAALTIPLVFLSFRPVEEIDSLNYLHYLIDWMANRATPYTFATNYVAFWELSFLPTWMVTGVDLFFPLLALKALVILALAAWLAGRELRLRRGLLLWTVFGALTLRHFWFEYSGVPTLKNDALHGAGFVLLALVAMRGARRNLLRGDAGLLAFGCAFAAVKYTGIFVAALAIAVVLFQHRSWVTATAAAGFTALTSGHYYLHNLAAFGSPFYPFQINLGFIHLPGTADLSATSILYSLRDPHTWQLLFLPANGLSPAGLLFPVTLAGTLGLSAWCLVRPPSKAHRYAALFLLAGWFLFFRSVYSASAYPGDLVFLRSSLNTVRYVDGVLALSEVFLVSLLVQWPRLAGMLVAANLVSRLAILYPKVNGTLFPPRIVAAFAVSILLIALATADWRRRHVSIAILVAVLCLLAACPILVERNRALWTTYWNGLKPTLAARRPGGLAHLALPDGGYFAGHVVAAGNPVDVRVRSLLAEEVTALSSGRPPSIATLITPGSSPHVPDIEKWGYRQLIQGANGGVYELK